MKKIYLHVGPYKTGTTALQTFFYLNRNKFKQQGIVYPLEYSRVVHDSHGLLDGNIGLLCNGDYSDKQIAEKIIELVNKYGCILLSNETLFFHMLTFERCTWLQKIIELCNDIKIIIIAYLRKQCDYIESFYNHRVKWQKITMDIQTWYQNSNMEQLLDYEKNLSFFENIVGKENMRVKVYEKEQFFGGNIYSDFLTTLSLPETNGYEYPPKRANQSFDHVSFQVKKIINKANITQNDLQRTFFYPALDNIKEDSFTNKTAVPNFILSHEEKQAFMKHWNSINHRVAMKYFGRDDLFLSEINLTPPPIPTDREILERGIQVLSTALVYTNKEIQKLKYERFVEDLFFNISDVISKNWENIIIYGAGNAGTCILHLLKRRYKKQNLIFAQTVMGYMKKIENISIHEIGLLKKEMDTGLVIVATTTPSIHEEMVDMLKQLHCKNYVTLL